MIQAFDAYIKTITAFMIFSVFVQMLVPNGNTKKYISLVLGLIMVMAVLNPAFSVLKNLGNWDIDALAASAPMGGIQNYSGLQQQVQAKIFKAELEEKIISKSQSLGVTITHADIETDENNVPVTVKLHGVPQNEQTKETNEFMAPVAAFGHMPKSLKYQGDIDAEQKVLDMLESEFGIPRDAAAVKIQRRGDEK